MAKVTATAAGPVPAVLYNRVSTAKQAASGLGLEAQMAACEAVARAGKYKVLGAFTDPAVSGKETLDRGKRPELGKMLDVVRANPGCVVITYALSRLSRRQKLTWDLLDEHGDYRLKVKSATEPFDTSSPMGKAMVGMIAIWNTLEADMCSERTSAALQARKARGLRLGPRPLAEQRPDVARQVHDMYEKGYVDPEDGTRRDFSHKTLAEELNRRGVPTMHGKTWRPTTVARTLRQPVRTPSAPLSNPGNSGPSGAPAAPGPSGPGEAREAMASATGAQ